MKITLTKISRREKLGKSRVVDGIPVAGKPFTSLGLQCQEYGDKWMSGFGNAYNDQWAVGDTVEVEVKEVPGTTKDGVATIFLNFDMPKRAVAAPLSKEQLDRIEKGVSSILDWIAEQQMGPLA